MRTIVVSRLKPAGAFHGTAGLTQEEVWGTIRKTPLAVEVIAYASHPIVTIRDEGAFDLTRHVGEETLPLDPRIPAVSEIRYIGKYVYEYLAAPNRGISDGKPWDKLNAPPPSFPSKNDDLSVIQNGLVLNARNLRSPS